MSEVKTPETVETNSRRETLKKVARFAAVSAPAVTLLLAATAKPKKAMAISVA